MPAWETGSAARCPAVGARLRSGNVSQSGHLLSELIVLRFGWRVPGGQPTLKRSRRRVGKAQRTQAANRIWRIPAPAFGAGALPISLQFPGVVNGATLRPRGVEVQTTCYGFGGFPIPLPCTESEEANEYVAPGELVAIRGECLGPLQVSQGGADATGHVATAIGDLQVLLNGVPAPLLSAHPNQLMVQVPYETAGASTANLEVQYLGQSVAVSLTTAVTSVGIFPVPNATCLRGSTVSLSITGAGQTNPSGVTGLLAGNPSPQPVAAVQVTVGGEVATVVSAMAEPGTIGVTQVTFVIPPDLNPGSTTIAVTVGPSSDSISAELN